MVATGVLMSLSPKQGKLLQVPSAPSEQTGISFATSFSELTANARMQVWGIPGQKTANDLNGKAALVEKHSAITGEPAVVKADAAINTILSGQKPNDGSSVAPDDSDAPVAMLIDGKAESVLVLGASAHVPAHGGELKPSVGSVNGEGSKKDVINSPNTSDVYDSTILSAGGSEAAGHKQTPPEGLLVAGKTEANAVGSAAVASTDPRIHIEHRTQTLAVRDFEEKGSQVESRPVEKGRMASPMKKESKSKVIKTDPAGDLNIVVTPSGAVGGGMAVIVPSNEMAPVVPAAGGMSKTAGSESFVVGPARAPITVGGAEVRMDAGVEKGRAQSAKGESKRARMDVTATGERASRQTQKDAAADTKAPPLVAFPGHESKGQDMFGSTVATVHGVGALHEAPHVEVSSSSKVHEDAVSPSVIRAKEEAGATAAPVSEGHRTLVATPTMLEVGVASGTHGWLKVRAEMTGGGVVSASLHATSSAGQEMLHRELPGLTAFLREERVGVSEVMLHSNTTDVSSRQFAGGVGGDTGQGQMQQNGGQYGDDGRGAAMAVSDGYADEALDVEGLSGASVTGWLAPAVYAGSGGGWLSVRV